MPLGGSPLQGFGQYPLGQGIISPCKSFPYVEGMGQIVDPLAHLQDLLRAIGIACDSLQ